MRNLQKRSPAINSRPSYQRILRALRRVHLYAGLFMAPFVLLYAITAFLFNHGFWFTDHDLEWVDEDATRQSLASLPAADSIATLIHEKLVVELQEGDQPPLVRQSAGAQYVNDAAFEVEDSDHNVKTEFILHLDGGGRIHRRVSSPEIPTPLGSLRNLKIESLRQEMTRVGQLSIDQLGLQGESRANWGPPIEYGVSWDGVDWIIYYNPSNGDLRSRPAAGWPGHDSVRQFLLRLHTTHGYPWARTAQTVWAIMVDLMVLSMVTWVVTGVLMGWQMVNLRRWGAITLGISCVWIAALALAMYHLYRHT